MCVIASGEMRGGNSDEADPFARLIQTHRRLEDRLKQLRLAAEDLAQGVGVTSALFDIEEVAGFLSRGAVRHVEDEEQTLFPKLRAYAELGSVLGALEAEHGEHRALELEVRNLAEKWAGNVPLDPAEPKKMLELAQRLAEVYAAHIAREEQELFPRARALLDAGTIAEMGREMMERRPDRGKDKR